MFAIRFHHNFLFLSTFQLQGSRASFNESFNFKLGPDQLDTASVTVQLMYTQPGYNKGIIGQGTPHFLSLSLSLFSFVALCYYELHFVPKHGTWPWQSMVLQRHCLKGYCLSTPINSNSKQRNKTCQSCLNLFLYPVLYVHFISKFGHIHYLAQLLLFHVLQTKLWEGLCSDPSCLLEERDWTTGQKCCRDRRNKSNTGIRFQSEGCGPAWSFSSPLYFKTTTRVILLLKCYC